MGNCMSCSVKPASITASTQPIAEDVVPNVVPIEEIVKATLPSSTNLKVFSFLQIETITNGFSNENYLGRGGFGPVYKGFVHLDTEIRSQVQQDIVAIKRLDSRSDQGDKEWLTEIDFLGQLKHENLVKLIGYSYDEEQRCLVYEYLHRGSLEKYIYSDEKPPLIWPIRKKIVCGAAMGLAFMHKATNQVVMRDFKASNILLDEDFTPKLCDFGIARLGPKTNESHVSTRIMGTPGYIAPEYRETGHLTDKSDVYSFGVLLLELLTGRKAVDRTRSFAEQDLAGWARPFLTNKETRLTIVDPRLQGIHNTKEISKFAKLAYDCICHNPKGRPEMKNIVDTLMQVVDKYN